MPGQDQETQLRMEFMANVGLTLIELQKTEWVLRETMTHFVRALEGITWDQLTSLAERDRKKTLGYFANELKQCPHLTIRLGFDERLDKFVRNRNIFAHNLRGIPNLDLGTHAGLIAGIDFCRSLTEEARDIAKLLKALADVLMGQGFDKVIGPGADEEDILQLRAIGTFLQPDDILS